MFAGKSSYLLEHGGRYEAVGLRVAFVKYKGDSRLSALSFASPSHHFASDLWSH